jgi:hypothetical protein
MNPLYLWPVVPLGGVVLWIAHAFGGAGPLGP